MVDGLVRVLVYLLNGLSICCLTKTRLQVMDQSPIKVQLHFYTLITTTLSSDIFLSLIIMYPWTILSTQSKSVYAVPITRYKQSIRQVTSIMWCVTPKSRPALQLFLATLSWTLPVPLGYAWRCSYNWLIHALCTAPQTQLLWHWFNWTLSVA
jgi:hypothetical protein